MNEGIEKPNLKLNYIFNTSYQILVLIVPLITTPYISRVLGAEGVGIYSYTQSIVSYFVLFASMGTATFGQRAIAYEQENKYERSKKFFEILLFRIGASIISLIAYFIYINFICDKNKTIAELQMIYIIAVMFDITWLFQGIEDFKRVVLRNVVVKIFNIIFIFLLIKDSSDVWKYTCILAGMTLLGNISVWPYLRRYISLIPLKNIKPLKNTKEIIQLFIPTIAIQVYTYLDKTMIGHFDDTGIENGYYEQTEKVVRMALAIITSLGTVMIPRISKMYADNNMQKLNYYLDKSFRFIFMLGFPIMFGMMALTKIFVPVFYGTGFDKIQILLPLYSCLIIAVSFSNVIGCQFLIPTRRQHVYTISVTISAVLNLILNSLLIPKIYSVGATLASICAEYLGAVIMIVYVRKKELLDMKNLFKVSSNYLFASIIMFLVVYMLSLLLKPSVIMLIVCIIIGVGMYSFILFILKDRLLNELLHIALKNRGGK